MEVVAWVGLVVSWLLLLFVMKFVFLLLRVLKQTRRLAEMSLGAAVRLADNLSGDEFADLEHLATQLPDAVRGLPRGAAAAPPSVSSVSPGLGGRPS